MKEDQATDVKKQVEFLKPQNRVSLMYFTDGSLICYESEGRSPFEILIIGVKWPDLL